jgi:predicted nucleic acid-binding Zn ribbon protein
MTTRFCLICGKKFKTADRKNIYCSAECRKIGNAENQRRNREQKSQKKNKKPNSELVRLAIEAREHGMSYGQYVGLMKL